MSSKPEKEKLTGRRVRRNYTEEFRRDAVGMIEREARRDALASEIRSIYSEQYLDVYGSPRMHQELLKRGIEVCENTVAAVIKQEGLKASTEKQFRVTTTGIILCLLRRMSWIATSLRKSQLKNWFLI